MRYLNTVYIRDHRARVRHRRGSLLVSSPEGSRRVPLEAIDAVVVLGSAQITTQALDACVRRGVRVAALQMSGAVRAVSAPHDLRVVQRVAGVRAPAFVERATATTACWTPWSVAGVCAPAFVERS